MYGEKLQLKNQIVEVVKCKNDDCGHLMVNIDADQLQPGDLAILKKHAVRISNPETEAPVCVNCEVKTLGRRIADWFESEDDDDSSFFSSTPSSSGSLFGGSSSFGGFGGGFGGFGGGSFGGGGAARGF